MGGRAPLDRAAADRARPARGLDHGHRPRRQLRHRWRRLRTGPPTVPGQQGARRRAPRLGRRRRDLLPDHGFPIRLLLPGWVGIGSIKWLGSLEVSTTEQTSPWNTKWYRMTGGDYPPDSPPLTVNPVRSAFELAWGATLVAAARRCRSPGARGAAPGRIARVDVSTDGGTTWDRADLRRGCRREAWTQWDYEWRRAGARRPRRHGAGHRRRRAAAAARSRRTTTAATSSTPWCGTRSRSSDPPRRRSHRVVETRRTAGEEVALRPSRNPVTVPGAVGTSPGLDSPSRLRELSRGLARPGESRPRARSSRADGLTPTRTRWR